jgi:hypothetical protein
MSKRGQAPPSRTPPLSGTFGAPFHPTKSAPRHRDFVGTPDAAQPSGPEADSRRSREDGLIHRAEPMLTATPELFQKPASVLQIASTEVA